MDKKTVIKFFDSLAPGWDSDNKTDINIINTILTLARISPGQRVLDVACGTGVLIPYYLKRDVKEVLGVDMSPGMIAVAESKYSDKRVSFKCCDAMYLESERSFDSIMVYNALPHFSDADRLIKSLSGHLRSGGRLSIAHGMSRDRLNALHCISAAGVSNELLPAEELAEFFLPAVSVDTLVSNDAMYMVSGLKL